VDDPAAPELRRRQPRHARHPLALSETFGGLADQVQTTFTRERLEDLGRTVAGRVVRRDHEVDPSVEVEGHLRVDDVRLVARKHGEYELHRPTARFANRRTLR